MAKFTRKIVIVGNSLGITIPIDEVSKLSLVKGDIISIDGLKKLR